MLLLWWAAMYPAICSVNTHLNIYSVDGGEWVTKQKKINHSLWWASDPREVPDPGTKNLFIYHCDTIRHGHPNEKMAEDSLSLPSPPLLLTLSLWCLFQEELCTKSVIFFSSIFLHFRSENLSLLDGHEGKKDKSNKALIGHAGRSQTITGQFTNTHTHTSW